VNGNLGNDPVTDGGSNWLNLTATLSDQEVRNLFSASGDLSYNAATGVFSFTETPNYTDADVDAHLTGGTGVNYSSGTISHSDTSSQASVSNSGSTVIQDVTLDGFGHVTGLSSATINEYSDTDALNLFNVTGSAPVYACRAWVNFSAFDPVTIRESGNISSVVENFGRYEVNFATPMLDDEYAAVTGVGEQTEYKATLTNFTTTKFEIYGTNAENSNVVSPLVVCASVFR